MKSIQNLIIRSALVAVVVGLLVAPTASADPVPAQVNTAAKTTILGSGSVAFSPYLLAAFKKYKKVTKGQVEVIFTVNSGNNGVKDVQTGKSQFAANARAPLPGAIDAGTTYYKAAKDGMAIIVSKKNKVKNLSIAQLGDIFSGKVTNWNQVGGSDAPIEVNGRDAAGGQYNFFRDAVLGGKDLQIGNKHPNDGLVASAVSNSPNAIGYLGQGFVKTGKKVKYKLVTLNRVPLNETTVRKGKYPLWRFLYLVTPNTTLAPPVKKLIAWLLTSYDAGQAFRKAGAVPYKQSTKPPKKKKKKKK